MNLPDAIMDSPEIRDLIIIALQEDVGSGDVTTNPLVSEDETTSAYIIARAGGIICGLQVSEAVFKELDKNVSWEPKFSDGDSVRAGEEIAKIHGSKRAILTGERTALNFLQRMSGIATLTGQYVEEIRQFPAKILDTRKTLPRFRRLDKYAVKCGGGENHRFGLHDMALIKENHIAVAGGIEHAVRKIRSEHPEIRIEVETTNLREIEEALNSAADQIMLDNMSLDEMKEAVRLIDGRVPVEASGGIDLSNVAAIAETGVDFISIGAITHSVPALDLSMLIKQTINRRKSERCKLRTK
jgi:nicotinate-nucleotide pyrophosphorylase (carboxylating)